jgi:hypothetical protein
MQPLFPVHVLDQNKRYRVTTHEDDTFIYGDQFEEDGNFVTGWVRLKDSWVISEEQRKKTDTYNSETHKKCPCKLCKEENV